MSGNQLVNDEATCVSLQLADMARVFSVTGATAGGNNLLWFRCIMSSQSISSGWYMSDSNWDAIKINVKRRVRLVGSGVFPPTGDPPSKPPGWKLEIKIVVDGTQTDIFIFTSADENWDAENKIFKCIFRDHGGNDIVCDAG